MSDENRFKKRRVMLRNRGLCVRCGAEKAAPAHTKCKRCALENAVKKLVAPPRRYVCEKIGRLERTRAIASEAIKAIDAKLAELRA